MARITIHDKATVNAHGLHNGGTHKPVVCITDRKFFVSGMDAAEYYGVSTGTISLICNGKQNCTLTQKGVKKFCFLSQILEHLDELFAGPAEEIEALKKEIAAYQKKAEVCEKENEALKRENEELKKELAEALKKASILDKLYAELEEEQKAEEERQKAIAEAEKMVEQRKRICEQQDAEYQRSVSELMEAEKKLAELKGDAKE